MQEAWNTMSRLKYFAVVGAIITGVVTLAAAQSRPTPVMRLGDWVEVGGTMSMVVVSQAETRLKAVGFEPSPVDGIADAQTCTALRQYQRQHGLSVTGVLDVATQKALGIGERL